MNQRPSRPKQPVRGGERPRNHHLIRCGTVRGCLRAPAYRVGDEYHWQSTHPSAERVIVGIDPECRFGRDAAGEVLVYRRRCPAWFPLTSAMLLGWCWVVEPDNCGLRRVEGFVTGEHFSVVPAAEDTEPVALWLRDGTRCRLGDDGLYLFFRGEWGVGFPLVVALKDGWCSTKALLGDHALLSLDGDSPSGRPIGRKQMPAA